MKRILAGFMAVIIMLTSPAYAEEKKADGDTVRMVPEEGLKVEGTNSFGSLLANTLAGEAEGRSCDEGYNIFSIDIQGKVAQVSFETMEDASLVVGIYDESGIEMLASGTIAVTHDQKEASVAGFHEPCREADRCRTASERYTDTGYAAAGIPSGKVAAVQGNVRGISAALRLAADSRHTD